MGLSVSLYIHQEEDLVIDIDAANKEIMATNIAQQSFYEQRSDPQWKGPLLIKGDKFLIADTSEGNYLEGYEEYCSDARGAFEEPDTFDIIAKHVTAGKLVFRQEVEGHADYYYVITPGSSVRKDPTF